MTPIRNIIFDLGGVLLDIDFTLSHKAFEKAGVKGFADLYSQHSASPFFVDFEKGKIETSKFFDHIRKICGCDLDDTTIRNCWNALLKTGFTKETTNWLEEIGKRYRMFLFSNTNIIHYQWFSANFYAVAGKEFNSCFGKAYYSHEMGLRKPDAASYQLILDEQGLAAAETLFIDDTIKNIDAARGLGLQTVHLVKPMNLLELGL